jgi:hypothetical protein
MEAITNLLSRLALAKKDPEVDPAEHGWELDYEHEGNRHFTKEGGWVLYQSTGSDGWVLDLRPKDQPGVVDRIPRLTESEMETVNGLSSLEHIQHRVTAR